MKGCVASLSASLFGERIQDFAPVATPHTRVVPRAVETARSAQMGTARHEISQPRLGTFGEADAHALADRIHRSTVVPDPQASAPAQVQPVVPQIDAQGFRQAPRPARQVAQTRGVAGALHVLNAGQGFEGAQQHAGADAGSFARHVEHVRGAVAQVDIGVAGFQKKRAVARGHAAERVTSRIGLQVGLGLDDTSAEQPLAHFAYDDLAQKESSERDRIARQHCAVERRHTARAQGCQGINSKGRGVAQW